MLSNCYHCSRQHLGLKSQPPIKSVSCTMTWPSMKNAMDASYSLFFYLVCSRYWYRTFIQTYSATSPLKSTLGNGQNVFAKLLSKPNNLSGSGRIFALPLPQKKDCFHHFQLPLPHPCLELDIFDAGDPQCHFITSVTTAVKLAHFQL